MEMDVGERNKSQIVWKSGISMKSDLSVVILGYEEHKF
jgi:hypothetical protein